MNHLPLRVCRLFVALVCLSPLASNAGEKEDPGSFHLFILSGQSNMTRTLSESFRSCVERVFGKDQVRVVMMGHPGQPIKKWDKDWLPPEGMEDPNPEGNGELFERLMNAVKRGLKDERPATVTLIWMQGEADAVSGWASVYEKSFFRMMDRIKTDLDVDDLNFVVGRINEHWLEKTDGKQMRELQVQLGEENSNGAWINTDDLNRGVNPWGGFSFEDGHYPPAGYEVMGQRFAGKACLLVDPEKELAPAIYKEHFIDSHEDISTHAAIDMPVTMNGKAGGAALTDGRFGGADQTQPAWTGIAPSDQPVEIVVDLGRPVVVEEIGVNMLIGSAAKAEFPDKLVYSTSEVGDEFIVNNSRYNTIKFYNRKLLNQMRSEGIKPQSIFLLTQQNSRSGPVKASQVKIKIETGDQWVFIDEIVINPELKE